MKLNDSIEFEFLEVSEQVGTIYEDLGKKSEMCNIFLLEPDCFFCLN